MAFSTYSDLQAAVLTWTKRTGDTAFAALVPDFIRLAEARFNRVLRTSAQESAFASTALVDGAASLPVDFLAFKELRFDGDASYTLEPRPQEWLRGQAASSAQPLYFAITGSQVICWPTAGSIKGTYYAQVPALASNSSNWLLTNHPDLYLFATLTEAALYMEADDRIPLWADKAAALLEQVKSADVGNQINGGPLTARAR